MRTQRSQPSRRGRSPQPLLSPSSTQTIRQVKRRAREREAAIVLLIALEAVEVLRRAPWWLLLLLGVAAGWLGLLVAEHIWLVVGGLAGLVGLKILRGAIDGWREWDDIPF
jgi:hypothetical protein